MTDTPVKIKISHRKKARNLLLQSVYQWQISNGPVADIEAQYRTDNTGKIDWDFFHEAFIFVTSNSKALDASYTAFLDRKVEDLNPIELALLRLGCFELQMRIDVPYKVVINEYVDLAKKYGATDSHKYINGILDKAARDSRKIEINANK